MWDGFADGDELQHVPDRLVPALEVREQVVKGVKAHLLRGRARVPR